MESKELILHIALNLGRLCRWAMEGRRGRVDQFISQTSEYLQVLETMPKSARFMPTFERFKSDYFHLCNNVRMDADWAEAVLTWSNILTHRAKLA